MANTDMRYEPSPLVDKKSHNNSIEKIYYFERIDKVILYEQNVKSVRIYNGSDLQWVQDIDCPASILAIEYCIYKNMIAISLADRTIVFFAGKDFETQEGKEKSTKKITH